MHDYKETYNRWLDEPAVDAYTKAELLAIQSDDEIKSRFNGYMSFGTAGLRSVMGAGTSRMNLYTVAHATEGLARLILKTPGARRW